MIGIVSMNEPIENMQFLVNTVEEMQQLKGGAYKGYKFSHGSTCLVKETRQVFFYDEENDEWFLL